MVAVVVGVVVASHLTVRGRFKRRQWAALESAYCRERNNNVEPIWILGAGDPEMEAIEAILKERGQSVAFLQNDKGWRVRPGEAAYRTSNDFDVEQTPLMCGEVYLVEPTGFAKGCARVLEELQTRLTRVIDHHNPGDPGYGKPPEDYWAASSIGQVCAILGVPVTDELRCVAAADHCLAHAYRGACPEVEPEALMAWRAASRAAFQRREVGDVLREVETARAALRAAPEMVLHDGETARDMRGLHVPELPEASAREGLCFVSESLPDEQGRVKTVCMSGTPAQIHAFMQWCKYRGLSGLYGDPARGFAGGYRTVR